MPLEPSLRRHNKFKNNKKTIINLPKIQQTVVAVIKAEKFLKKISALESQLGLFIIVIFSLVMNLSIASAKNIDVSSTAGVLSGMSPEAVADVAKEIGDYTPIINEDGKKIKFSMVLQSDDNYFVASDQFSTNLTPEDTKPIENAPKSRVSSYSIAPGDTLSQIAAKFDLTVATLKHSNNISDSDDLKVDQLIKIPAYNLSNNTIAKLEKKNTKTYAYSRTTIGRDTTESNQRYIVPVSHSGISQGMSRYHHGIDYMCSVGTPIKASAGGVVVEAYSYGWNYGWGKTVLISHGNGVTTRYGHLSQVNVKNGERVSQGEIIGRTGNTGRSTGPHLHFQKNISGQPVYPYN